MQKKKQLKDRATAANHKQTWNKCCTEMNSSHPCMDIWRKLNINNKCDSNTMATEAASKCINNWSCIPCQRIEFILNNLVGDNCSIADYMNINIGDFMSDYKDIHILD